MKESEAYKTWMNSSSPIDIGLNPGQYEIACRRLGLLEMSMRLQEESKRLKELETIIPPKEHKSLWKALKDLYYGE